MNKFKAKFYGIPCFYTEKNNLLEGRNNFYEFILSQIAIPVHLFFVFVCSYVFDFELLFPIKTEEETGG